MTTAPASPPARRRPPGWKSIAVSALAVTLLGGGDAVASTASAAESETYQTVFLGDILTTDHDDLSANEHCIESFFAPIAILDANDPAKQEASRHIDFNQCDDSVVPKADLRTVLRSDRSVHITGSLSFHDFLCRFNNTLEPCTVDQDFPACTVDIIVGVDEHHPFWCKGTNFGSAEFKVEIRHFKQNF
jgi:hypothetical protein